MKRRLVYREAIRIAVTYAVIAGLYILLSDRALGLLLRSPSDLTQLQTYKGWGFVIITAALLYAERTRSAIANERASHALRQSEDRYHRLFEEAPISLLEIDLSAAHERIVELQSKGLTDLSAHLEMHPDKVMTLMSGARIVEVNQSALTLFEATDEDDLRAHFDGRIETGARSWIPILIERVASGLREDTMEIADRTRTGRALSLEMRWVVAQDTVPDYGRVLVSIVDLTRLHAAQQEIMLLNAHLEERVRERTTQLADANEELEAFAYSVSHDLRAPLRAIDGFSQALVEDFGESIPVAMLGYFTRIRSGTERMAQLIDDLLQFSRLNQTRMQVRRCDLSAAAEHIATRLVEEEPRRQVEFDIQPDLVARGDTHLLRVALENLLGNAWKFTSHHDRARIEFGATEDGEGTTVYHVRDDGAGFDMAYAGRLFGAFQRLHNRNEFEGTGIGLATVNRIIRRHGGSIWAEAGVERGACFFFTLDPDATPGSEGPGATRSAPEGG